MPRSVRGWGWAAAVWLAVPALSSAEVVRVEAAPWEPVQDGRVFGDAGAYETLTGRLHFAVDPRDPRNTVIADLDRAPRNAEGRVEFSGTLIVMRPVDPERRTDLALVDIANRGNRTMLRSFNKDEDGFLFTRGYTLVWVGWEFDLPSPPEAVRLEVPRVAGVAGVVRGVETPDEMTTEITFGGLRGYVPSDLASSRNTLMVLGPAGETLRVIPQSDWQLEGHTVRLASGFEPGRTYALEYVAEDAPVAGLGLAAVRDAVAWLRHDPSAVTTVGHALSFGSSQSGRFLRTFLYGGFNADERGRPVFDGVMSHIAGAARLELNRRWATPVSSGQATAATYPFTDVALRDPETAVTDGLLDNVRAREHQPKIFYTNTSVEYWGGARVAALVHSTPDGAEDVELTDHVRVYFFAGTQHGPARFPPAASTGQQANNPTDYWWGMRALLAAMEQWVLGDVEPPPSRSPRRADGTLVPVGTLDFPSLPAVTSPTRLRAGNRGVNAFLPGLGGAGVTLPLFVPQVDDDGNERAGIRLPEVAVPLATYTGWQFRHPDIGAPERTYPLLGSYVPFARTEAEREAAGDPRPSIAARYASREDYAAKVRTAVEGLVQDHYLLEADVPRILERARAHWDLFGPGVK